MPAKTHHLRWIPEVISNLMLDNNIHGRGDLAKRLGLGTTTVYRAFNQDWSGTATTTVLAQLAGEFRIPISRLVSQPGSPQRNLPKSGRR